MRHYLLIACISLGVGACETYPDIEFESVSVRYDPYNYSIGRLHKSAEAECMSRGFEGAFEEPILDDAEEQSEEGIRWAYMEFDCF